VHHVLLLGSLCWFHHSVYLWFHWVPMVADNIVICCGMTLITILALSLHLIDWESSRTFNTLSWYVIYHTAHLGTWRITIKTLHIGLSRSSQQFACIKLFNSQQELRIYYLGTKHGVSKMPQGWSKATWSSKMRLAEKKMVQDVGAYILAIFPLHCSL